MDESTSNNDKRILAILASYVCKKQNRVVVEHLKSIELICVNTANILLAIDTLFTEMNIPWSNLVSILMDSCAVMRGSKNGLETRIRREKAPQLLDIDGDSCHHIHNATKQFCKHFDWEVEGLATDLHNDFKWSADLKLVLVETCEMLGVSYTTPQRFLSHRWLSCYDVTVANTLMMDAYRVLYYGFLPKGDKLLYNSVIEDLLDKKNVSQDGKSRLKELWKQLDEKNMTEDGKARKRRIIEKIIIRQKKTDLYMAFYVSVLRLFKEYVLLFQTKAPMIHLLHDKQEQLFRDFLGCFVKPENIVNKTAAQLKKLQLKSDEGLFLRQDDIFMGTTAENIVASDHKDAIVTDFLKKATAAYIECGSYLQRKLPLDNNLIRSLSAVDPYARGHSETAKCLKSLRTYTTHFLSSEEQDEISMQAYRYQVDISLPDHSDMTVDQWWCAVQASDKYPALSKMVMVLLTCFHGPLVESSFNLMGDIIDQRSCKMNVTTFNAIQTVKYGLTARQTTAVKMFGKSDVMHTRVDKRLCVNMRTAAKKQKELWQQSAELKRGRQDKLKGRVLSASKARHSMEENEKRAKLSYKQNAKRKATERLVALVAKRKKTN